MQLKEYLKRNRWSIAEMARKVGVSPVYASSIVNGHIKPSIALAMALCEFTEGHTTLAEILPNLSECCALCGQKASRYKILRRIEQKKEMMKQEISA